jgi:hypothetical protein
MKHIVMTLLSRLVSFSPSLVVVVGKIKMRKDLVCPRESDLAKHLFRILANVYLIYMATLVGQDLHHLGCPDSQGSALEWRLEE